MKILHILSRKGWGGGERYALDLCRRLHDDGHGVTVIARKGNEAVQAVFAENGLRVIPMSLSLLGRLTAPKRVAEVLNLLTASKSGNREPVIVHVHNFEDAATAVSARSRCKKPDQVKIVYTRHRVLPAVTGKKAEAVYAALDAIIFVSDVSRRKFLTTAHGLNLRRMFVVHNSLRNIPDVQPQTFELSKIKLVYVGRIAADKGLDVLADAMGLLPPGMVSLELCGDGDSGYIKRLKRKFEEADGGSVTFSGSLRDVAPAYARANAGVIPTIVPEAFGLAVLECMAAGRTVITTNNGAQREITDDGENAFLVPPGNAAALADTIRNLALHPDVTRRAGELAAMAVRSRFDYNSFYNKILSIYQQV